jgi:TrmH family RNA methyltransferase
MITELSKSKTSLIRSLSVKKYRQENNLFVAEGYKIISEILNSDYKIKYLIYNETKEIPSASGDFEIIITDESGMKKISNLKTTPGVLAVVEIPIQSIQIQSLKDNLTMVVEDIQDPGNLGTLLRICDWFGIENLICSHHSADVYNPKVIQASMGAFLRINVQYTDLPNFILEYKETTGHSCFGTFLEGENIYTSNLPQSGLFILGNEGNGISVEVEALVDKKIHIPSFSAGEIHAESLNISVAAAIVASEFRRR